MQILFCRIWFSFSKGLNLHLGGSVTVSCLFTLLFIHVAKYVCEPVMNTLMKAAVGVGAGPLYNSLHICSGSHYPDHLSNRPLE